MNVIALIPARSGSKRIPGKNLKTLGGKPLLVWSILAAQVSELISQIYVSSDSDVILDIAKVNGATPIKRPAGLAGDLSPDLDVVSHLLNSFPGIKPDLVAYLRPTTPFRSSALIDMAISNFEMTIGGVSPSALRSVEKEPETSFKSFTLGLGNRLDGIAGATVEEAGQCNQEFEPTYKGNGYIDIIRPCTVANGMCWGDEVMGFETPPVIELDIMDDWERAENHILMRGGKVL